MQRPEGRISGEVYIIFEFIWLLCKIVLPLPSPQGLVAEWLGRGLQNLVQRFESARDLLQNPDFAGFFVWLPASAVSS